MSLQNWGNLAQVIGAVAVVISLIYVGFQVKRNTSAVRSATAQAIHNNYGDWYERGNHIQKPDHRAALSRSANDKFG